MKARDSWFTFHLSKMRSLLLLLGLGVIIAIATTTHANDYFVNPTGAGGAFTSVQAAINAVPVGTAANRTRIFIAPGTYTETAGANANLSINKAFVTLIGQGATPGAVVIQNNLTGLNGSTRIQSG